MSVPDIRALYEVVEATWPAARVIETPNWTLRDGAGGGKRVSAATARGEITRKDVAEAATAMRDMGQAPLFMLRMGEESLDGLLAGLGYEVIDPVNLWACPVGALTVERPPRLTTFHIWEPMAIQRDIWAAGGIGADRVAVMERGTCPRTSLFGRSGDRPAATAYVAIHARIAMVHALEVLAAHRRRSMGRHLMIEAALWAQAQGAGHLSVVCTKANAAANGLYASLGLTLVGDYHYRIQKDA